MSASFLMIVSLATLAPQGGGKDWPCYLGPNRDGKAPAAEIEFDWADEAPEVAWRIDVGPGFGGASVYAGEVYFLDREVGDIDILRVMELESGEPLWDAIYEAPGRLSYAGSRTVPAVTEKHIITCGGQGRVTCFDRKAQLELWSVSLEEDYGGVLPGYGWSSSPLVVGDLVVLTALGAEVGLVALDRATGEEVWVTDPVGISHSTPVVMNLLGEEQILFVSTPPGSRSLDEPGVLTISSFDPVDGSVRWEAETLGSVYPIPGPVQVGEDRIFVTGGYRGGSSLLRLMKEGGAYELERLFRSDRGSQVHTPILHEDHFYLVVNENWNHERRLRAEGGLLCLDLDGKERWRTGADPFFGRGNSILVGDHLLVQDGLDGSLHAVLASPEGFQEVGSIDVFEVGNRRDNQMWAPMAFANGHLILRSQEELVCLRF